MAWVFLMEKTMENEIKVGQRFGKLVVLSTHTSQNGNCYCFCKCDCGEKGITAYYNSLLSGKATSCLKCKPKAIKNQKTNNKPKRKRKEANPLIKHPLHQVWSSMIMRCENPKRPYYYLYGGRGIKVCKEWRNNYLAFYDWAIKNGYKLEMLDFHRNRYTLDRIDINGDYTPENCRWVDYREQNENKRHNLILEIDGEKKKIIEWLHQFNAKTPYFYSLLREGMTELQAIEYIRNS